VEGQAETESSAGWSLPPAEDILECTGDGFLALDGGGVIRYANPAAAEMLGRGRSELAGLELAQAIPQLRDVALAQQWQRALAGDLPQVLRVHLGEAGEGREYELRLQRCGCGLAAHLRPVAGLAMHLSDYARVIHDSGDLIFTVDQQYRYLVANRALLEHYALPAEQVIGRSMPEVVGEAVFREKLKPLIDRCLRGESVTAEIERDFPGRPRHILRYACFPMSAPSGTVSGAVIVARSVTAARMLEQERRATVDLLRLLNNTASLLELTRGAIAVFREFSGCEAVGIRLKQGDDYPYIETVGFSDEFVLGETFLGERDAEGKPLLDGSGRPLLVCTCGLVLSDPADKAALGLTEHGSFWTNNGARPESWPEQRYHPRNRCLRLGYESLALIPLRNQGQTLGLLQLADHRPGLFSDDKVGALERLADSLAIGLARRQADEETRRTDEQLRSLVQHTLDGVVIIDSEGRILEWNPAYERMTGIPREEAVGRPLWELQERLAPAEMRGAGTLARARSMVQAVVDTMAAEAGGSEFPEVVIERPDGERRVIQATTFPMRAGKDLLYGSVIRDVTSHARAEEESRRAAQSLRESEERLRQVLEQMPYPVAVFSAKGAAEFANRAFLDLFGLASADQIVGSYSLKDEVLVESLGLSDCIRRAFAGEVVNLPEVALPAAILPGRAPKSPGEKYSFELTAFPVFLRPGELSQVVFVCKDISAEKQLREQLLQAQKMESVGRLAGGIAHDFNNLLTAIIGNLSFARDSLPADSAAGVDIEQALRATERATNLTRQLLAFSRRQVLAMQIVNLNDVIMDMHKLLRRLLGEDIELVTLPAQDLGLVRADPGQIEQVLVNLAVNARDAMPVGGTLTIETANARLDEEYCRGHAEVQPGEYVMIGVSDTGMGMRPEVMAHLFEPFFTTKEQGKGTGLGLATVHGIIKQHGGAIFVYSEPRKGTTFKIYLPRAETAEFQSERAQEPEPATGGNETILLVEDETSVRLVAMRALQRLGYRVLEASHGEEAMDLAMDYPGPIHLLVTDVVMPRMGGRELASRLQHLRPGLKVLFASGYTDNAIVHQGVLEDGTSFMQKPFTATALARKVREVLDKQRG